MRASAVVIGMTAWLAMTGSGWGAPTALTADRPEPEISEVQGRVLGSEDVPLAGVFILQKGGTGGAVTGPDGRYKLRIERSATGILTLIAAGYLPHEVALGQHAEIRLKPIPTYVPGFASVAEPVVPRPTSYYDSRVGAAYRMRYLSYTARSRGLEGWINNEFEGNARLRLDRYVMRLDAYRLKAPVTIVPLAVQPAPEPSVETSRWGAWLGYQLPILGLEVLPQVGYAALTSRPTNTATPWSGTPLDHEHSRQGPGIALEAGKLIGKLSLGGRVSLNPSFGAESSSAPYPVAKVHWAETGLGAGLDILPGLQLEISAVRQWDTGDDIDEWANIFAISLSYVPARLRK